VKFVNRQEDDYYNTVVAKRSSISTIQNTIALPWVDLEEKSQEEKSRERNLREEMSQGATHQSKGIY
jgi:hypothetical protein